MKSFFAILTGITACLSWVGKVQSAEAPAPSSDLVARMHFAGFGREKSPTSGAALDEIWRLPVSLELRNQTLEKLSAAAAAWFQDMTGADRPDRAAWIRPLLEDLCQSEALAEVRAPTGGSIEWTLAIHLNEERTRLWQSNCARLLRGGKEVQSNGLIPTSFAAANSWFVIGNATSDTASHSITNTPVFRRTQAEARPSPSATNYLLKAELNPAVLAERLARPGLRTWPSAELTLSARGRGLRTQARLDFPKAMNWKVQPWQIPTHTIRDAHNSLTSFTAVQGFAPWLGRQSFWRELELTSPPNQLFVWGQAFVPFQIQAAFPAKDATEWLKKIASHALTRVNRDLAAYAVGEVHSLTNRDELLWLGLPMIVPYLRPAPEPDKEFLWAGIFPMDLATNPPPPALMAQVTGRTNLLFYEWEITQGRLSQLRPLGQLLSAFTTVPTMKTNSASFKWLDAIQPKLGNTITELAVTSPRQLTLVRNSHIGLNGLEVLALAYWLDSAHFPRIDGAFGFKPAVPSRGPNPTR